jgi:excisionase family DNA binding protein
MPDPTVVTDWDELPIMVPLSLAAATIGVARSTLYNLLERGDLRAKRVGEDRVFITKTELKRYCEGAT